MRLLSTSSAATLLLISSSALAGGADRIAAAPGGMTLAGPVTVDLQADPAGSNGAFVLGTLGTGDDASNVLVQISTGDATSTVSPGVVDALHLKAKKVTLKGRGDVKVVVLPSVSIGDAIFTDVTAIVPEKGNGVDLGLSLAALGVAWSVSPSTGKVTLAPLAQGADLVGQVGGTTVPFTAVASTTWKYGKDKTTDLPQPVTVQGTVAGQALTLAVGLGMDDSVSKDITADGPRRSKGDQYSIWAPTSVGGLELGSAWFRQKSMSYMSQGSDEPVLFGKLGDDLLSGYDLASDGTGTLAFKAAAEQHRADPRPVLLSQAEKDLNQCLNPKEPPTGEAAEKSDAERCSGAYTGLASAQLLTGDLAGALASQGKVAEATPGKCDAWAAVGELQLTTGDVDGAIASFGKASTQYHAWWDVDAYTRDDSKRDFDKLEDDQQQTAEVQPQDASCFTADGMLALAWLVKGDDAQVAQIYQAHRDLDPGLPAVYGSLLLMQDKVEAAHGAWRMVDQLTLGPTLAGKAGLGRLFAQQNDWQDADINYQAALAIAPDDATVTAMWIDDLVRAKGAHEAMDVARTWAAQRPDSLAARFGVARAAQQAAVDPGFLTADADALFEDQVHKSPLDADKLATWSRYLSATGRVAGADKAAERALAADPTSAHAWLAKAEVQLAQGDTAGAHTSMVHAAEAGGQQPGYALLLQAAN